MQKLQIKEEIMAVAALLALGMLAITLGLIADSALTKSTNQVPNVVTQIIVGYCLYSSFTGATSFGGCLQEAVAPGLANIGGYGTTVITAIGGGHLVAWIGSRWGWDDVVSVARTVVLRSSRYLMFSPKLALAVAG